MAEFEATGVSVQTTTTIPGMAGVVLAGGASSRMGEDKASLVMGGSSLLAHARQLLSDSGCEKVFASGRRHDCEITGETENQGPLAGIAASLLYCRVQNLDSIVFLPVDMPRLSAASIRQLIALSVASRSAAHFACGPLPVCLPVNDETCTLAAAHLAGPDRSLRAWLQDLDARRLEGIDETQFLNINYPEQWQTYVSSPC